MKGDVRSLMFLKALDSKTSGALSQVDQLKKDFILLEQDAIYEERENHNSKQGFLDYELGEINERERRLT